MASRIAGEKLKELLPRQEFRGFADLNTLKVADLKAK